MRLGSRAGASHAGSARPAWELQRLTQAPGSRLSHKQGRDVAVTDRQPGQVCRFCRASSRQDGLVLTLEFSSAPIGDLAFLPWVGPSSWATQRPDLQDRGEEGLSLAGCSSGSQCDSVSDSAWKSVRLAASSLHHVLGPVLVNLSSQEVPPLQAEVPAAAFSGGEKGVGVDVHCLLGGLRDLPRPASVSNPWTSRTHLE